MDLRALSLCSGVGGLDLGLSRWCRTVGYVERDAYAQAVLVARMEGSSLDRAPVWPDLERAGENGSQPVVLNPLFVETLMGFPLGWTDCGVSATPSSPPRPSSPSSDSQPG